VENIDEVFLEESEKSKTSTDSGKIGEVKLESLNLSQEKGRPRLARQSIKSERHLLNHENEQQ